jgi:UDP-glucose 4-epimerase
MMQNKKYLITGGAGFIGSNLAEFLIDNDCDVIIVDDLSSGHLKNIDTTKVEFIKKKIQDIEIGQFEDIDGVFHLGAQASVPLSMKEFYASSLNNLASSLKVIEIAKLYNIPLVYATSSAIYGNLPFGDELEENFDIRSPYALDKLVLEQYTSMAHDTFDLSSIGLRFFNVYGPKQDHTNPYSGVISIFADRIINHQDIIINGGYQTRDFVFIGDIVKVLYQAMKVSSTKKVCEVLNVGTGVSVSIDDLAKIIAKIVGFDPKVYYNPLDQSDPERSAGNYEKLKKVLGMNIDSFISLEEGLDITIEYMKSEAYEK